jgi:MFS family permease
MGTVAFHAVSEPPSRLRRALRAVAVDVGLLRRRRDYRLLVGGQFVSLAGSELTFVAVPFQTYALTRSSLAVGLLGVAEFAPILVLALVGGALADAFDRRRLVAIAEGGAAIVAALLCVNALLPDPHLWALYAGGALMAAFTALRRPPLDAMVPHARRARRAQGGRGDRLPHRQPRHDRRPALGGVLIAFAGIELTYALDAATFVVSLLALRAMRTPPPAPDAPAPSWRSIVEGVRFAGSRQELLGTYLVEMNARSSGCRLRSSRRCRRTTGAPRCSG